MAAFGLLHGIHGQGPDRVGHLHDRSDVVDLDLAHLSVDVARRRALDARVAADDFSHTTQRPVTDVAATLRLDVPFTPPPGQTVDDRFGPAVHLVSAWKIDKARDLGLTLVAVGLKTLGYVYKGHLRGLKTTRDRSLPAVS